MDILWMLVLLTVILIAIAIPFVVRSFVWNSIIKKMQKGNFKEALHQMETSSLYKLFFSEYERKYNFLRAYISSKDDKKVKSTCTELLHMNLNHKQAYQVSSLTFFYFLEAQDKEMCDKLLDHIEFSGDQDEIAYDKMLYRILIENKSEDIEFLQNLLKDKTEKEDQGMLQYLIGVQYMYLNDTKNANLYLNKAKNNLKGTPYHKKIKDLLA
ncbi:hypothetical protein [Floccifex sp.]|uniref:hypothetical protein n=1 Tax=Floccifex sp. TaxID=2815810 RepID=UPI002A751DE8|nr:hypothetical protein [Floccifex sp.]MDD7281980.1 hypothetical protein [Erysipelotrichaceae bacterium]MDY2957889.1 hypothetical protein [Floccifex sp.]